MEIIMLAEANNIYPCEKVHDREVRRENAKENSNLTNH